MWNTFDMKRITVFSIVCLLIIVGRAFSAPQTSTVPSPAWSQKVNGIEGRLLAQFINLKDGPREVMFLYLHNASKYPITITQPMFNTQLCDADGKEIPQSFSVEEALSGGSHYAVIPGFNYIGYNLGTATSLPRQKTLLCFL
jgi:hypothetical protein